MTIAKDSVVSLEVEIWDVWGTLLQSSEVPVEYLHGGYDEIFPEVETALEGKTLGDKIEVRLEPEEAFGDYDEGLVRVEPRSRFPAGLEVGMQFEGLPGEDDSRGDDEDEEDGPTIYTVTDIADDAVVLDGNHPLAGVAIKFRCRVVGVRPASAGEIERGAADDSEGGLFRVLH